MNARIRIARVVAVSAALSCLNFGSIVHGVTSAHVTDGTFTSPLEWTQPTASLTHFNVVGQTGGADLYADSDASNLYLMYDALNTPNLGLNQANSFFDVFFQVAPENEDYLVHILSQTGAFSAFEKTTGVVSPLNPDGSFDTGSPVWSPLTPDDLTQARFQAAVTQDSTDGHLLAEFQLTLQTKSNQGGFYSPDPAFWSASVGSNGALGVQDPPISSGIFQINPDGGVLVLPALGPNGAPALQPQDVVTPEPSSLVLAAFGLVGLAAWQWRRKR